MKKLILAAAVIFTVAFTSCTKENVQPTHKAVTVATKGDLAQIDDTLPGGGTTNPDGTTPPSTGDGH